MQIIAGSCRGMKLLTPKGELTRPTGARAREAIMQMLSDQLEDALFVDFFAGSGAMGLEALSRGCACCYFVENESSAFSTIEKNLSELGRRLHVQKIEGQRWYVLRQKAERSLPYVFHQIKNWSGEAVIIYADPPYGDACISWVEAFLREYAREKINREVTLVLESAVENVAAVEQIFSRYESEWEKLKSRNYGKAVAHFYMARSVHEQGD